MTDDIGGVWRTIGGRRVFIKDGDDLETAMKKSGKFKKTKKQNKNDNKKEIEKENRAMDKFLENNPNWEDGEYDTDEFDDLAATLGISRDNVKDSLYDRMYEKGHAREKTRENAEAAIKRLMKTSGLSREEVLKIVRQFK